jgi:hypothetical protein
MPDPSLKIKITTTADTTGARETERAIEQVADVAKKSSAVPTFTFLNKGADAANKLSTAAKGTSSALGELSHATSDAGRIVTGLAQASQGGIFGLTGIGNAARGTLNILKGFGPVLGTALGAVTGLGLAGIALLNRMSASTERAIKKIQDDAAKNSSDLKAAYAEVDAAAKASLDAQIAQLDQINARYQQLIGLMQQAESENKSLTDATRARDSAKLDASEQLALAKAKTPEERAAISAAAAQQRQTRDFDARQNDLENQKLAAQVHRQNAQEAAAAASQSVFPAEAAATKARQRAAELATNAQNASSTFGLMDQRAVDARNTALAAARASKAADADLIATKQKASDTIKKSEDETRTANATERQVGIQLEQLHWLRVAAETKASNATAIAASEAKATVEGDITKSQIKLADLQGQLSVDPDNADLQKSVDQIESHLATRGAALRKMTTSIQKHADAGAQAMAAATAKLDQYTRQAKNARSLQQ